MASRADDLRIPRARRAVAAIIASSSGGARTIAVMGVYNAAYSATLKAGQNHYYARKAGGAAVIASGLCDHFGMSS